MRLLSLSVALCLCLASPQILHASAFSVNQLGTRASGMGGAFVAIANDGSALFYNPAGIAFQKGMRIQMDGFIVKGFFHFIPSVVPPGTIVPEEGYNGAFSPKIQMIANLYATVGLGKKWTFGVGTFAPFGLGDNWTSFKDSDPANTKYVGRFAGTRGRMEVLWLQPTVAYRLSENSSIAVGPALVYSHLLLEQSILNPLNDGVVFGKQIASLIFPGQDPTLAGRSIARLLPEGRSRIAGVSYNAGFAAGYLLKHPKSKTNLGVMFRSPVTHHLKGKASFAFTDNYPLKQFIGANTIPNLFPAQDARGVYTTPCNLQIGIANSAFWDSTIAFDFQFQNYSRFKSIPLNFTQTVNTATPPELRLNFDFTNAYALRTGIERPFMGERNFIRAGYFFDHSPVPEKSIGPTFPDTTRHSITAGFSREFGNKEFSLFYEGTKFLHRTTNVAENANNFTNGEYRNFTHLIGFGLRIHLGGTAIRTDR